MSEPPLPALLPELEQLKSRFGEPAMSRLGALAERLAELEFPDASSLARFHEALLFFRAFPPDPEALEASERVLGRFPELVDRLRRAGADLAPFTEPEISGIAGTSLSAVYSYATVRELAHRHASCLEIDWEGMEELSPLGRTLPRFLPLLEEDSLVEAHVPYGNWIARAVPRGATALSWILDRISSLELPLREQAELYESLQPLVSWNSVPGPESRTCLRGPAPELFHHREPLVRRRDVSLKNELAGPPLPVTRLSQAEGQRVLDLAIVTSAVRYRELHAFTYGDPARVLRASAGRGVDIYVFGTRPEHRLPLRACHAAIFFKNGVPIGYFEALSLFDRMEAGFNIYYTFREGETAWLYARTLVLWRQLLGVSCFWVDPYQAGHENEEGIQSGAFWFYRKLGFRVVDPDRSALAAKEEEKIRTKPGYRTPARVLRKLAESPMVFEASGTRAGQWDHFQVRQLGFAVQRLVAELFGGDANKMRRAASNSVAHALGIKQPAPGAGAEARAFSDLALVISLIPDLTRWPERDKAALAAVIHAKTRPDESRYLLLMQRHARLREAVLSLGLPGT